MKKQRAKKRSTKKKAAKLASTVDLSRAILLVRWSTGNDVPEIGRAAAAFRADTQIAIHDAKDSDDLLAVIQQWLSAKRAQVLYIGAHGNSEGLKPTSEDYPTLTWNRLAGTLQAASAPLWVCLGACDSAFAASAWAKQSPDFLVSILFGFKSGKTTEDEVEGVLLELLNVTGLYTPGSVEARAERQEITTIEEDVRLFRSLSNRLVIYRRNLSSGVYEIVPEFSQEPDNSDACNLDLSSAAENPTEAIENLLGDEADEGELDDDLS